MRSGIKFKRAPNLDGVPMVTLPSSFNKDTDTLILTVWTTSKNRRRCVQTVIVSPAGGSGGSGRRILRKRR